MRPSRTARVDTKRPFKVAGANVCYGIAKRPFDCPRSVRQLIAQTGNSELVDEGEIRSVKCGIPSELVRAITVTVIDAVDTIAKT